MKLFSTDGFDERQLQIRGKIMTNCVIGNIVGFMVLAFINDMLDVDLVKMFGFSDILISIVSMNIMYLSIALIIQDAYTGFEKNMKALCYIMSALAILETVLLVIHLFDSEPLNLSYYASFIMASSISICMWMKKKDWNI